MSDYGDACATIRSAAQEALAKTSHITGLHHGDKAEAIVEAILAEVHDKSIAWAFREVIDRTTACSQSMTRKQKLASVRLQAPITAKGLRMRAQRLHEPWDQDEKLMNLEAAELIEKMLGLLTVGQTGMTAQETRTALAVVRAIKAELKLLLTDEQSGPRK